MTTYRANGKLLLTGEYLVLKGAVALALPTRLGQTLTVETMQTPSIQWDAYQPHGPWFSATLHPETLDVIATDDNDKATKLSEILNTVKTLNPSAIKAGLNITTHLDFDPEWGLGSSSTLIATLAQWADVNPYDLLQKSFGGSGYDIACATAHTAIHYKLNQGTPLVQPVDFHPPFADRLYFVYQGKKQRSSDEVKAFNRHWEEADLTNELQTVTELSMALPTVTYFEDFCTLLQVHEHLLASCLGRTPIQQQYPDFNGTLKSLGAWGGDFLLAATAMTPDEVIAYFNSKGLTTVFKYQDLIL